MGTSRQGTSKSTREANTEGEGSPNVPDSGPKQDYLPFIWQRLDSISQNISVLSEKYGRLDERTGGIQASIEKIDAKVSKIDSLIRWARAAVFVGSVVLASLIGLYKLLEPHLSFVWR